MKNIFSAEFVGSGRRWGGLRPWKTPLIRSGKLVSLLTTISIRLRFEIVEEIKGKILMEMEIQMMENTLDSEWDEDE